MKDYRIKQCTRRIICCLRLSCQAAMIKGMPDLDAMIWIDGWFLECGGWDAGEWW